MSGFRHSLSTIWRDFLTQTSLHGCKYTVARQHQVAKRRLWFLCIGIMVVILLYTTCKFYIKYREYNFVTKTSVTYHSELELPAITLCNVHSFDKNNFNKSDELFLEYFTYTFDITAPFNISESKWHGLRVSEEELNRLGFGMNDMIHFGVVDNNLLWNNTSHFTVTYRAPAEKCFTFNRRYSNNKYQSPLMFHDKSFLNLFLDVKQNRYAFSSMTAGVRLLLHHPDEPIHAHSPSTVLSPGHVYEIQISEKRYNYLPRPYNSYQNQDCIEVGKTNSFSEIHSPYSHARCVIKCLTDRTQSLCGCITESLFHDNTSDFCTIAERQYCALNVWRKYFHYTAGDLCGCKRPCSEVKYDYELSSVLFPAASFMNTLTRANLSRNMAHARNNLMYLKISLKDTMVTTNSHIQQLDFGDIIGQLGGYMGFCLGASLLTLMELVEVVLMSLKALIMHQHFKVNKQNVAPSNPGFNIKTVSGGI